MKGIAEERQKTDERKRGRQKKRQMKGNAEYRQMTDERKQGKSGGMSSLVAVSGVVFIHLSIFMVSIEH